MLLLSVKEGLSVIIRVKSYMEELRLNEIFNLLDLSARHSAQMGVKNEESIDHGNYRTGRLLFGGVSAWEGIWGARYSQTGLHFQYRKDRPPPCEACGYTAWRGLGGHVLPHGKAWQRAGKERSNAKKRCWRGIEQTRRWEFPAKELVLVAVYGFGAEPHAPAI